MQTRGKVVVVGAGIMGCGIAQAFLAAGYEAVLVDVREAALVKARQSIEVGLTDSVARGKIGSQEAQLALARLTVATDLASHAGDAELLLETATESLAVKHDIIRAAEPLLSAEAVIATNTSALSVTEIASAAQNRRRVVGMHFFNPAYKMKLLEIVRGLETSDECLDLARRHATALGKTAIVVNDQPGFATSRLSVMLGNEALYMLSEGVASAEDIDTAMRIGYNHPMGPLELGDATGWDTRLNILRNLQAAFGDKFRPCPLLVKMVSAGRLGRKTGIGVYAYDENGKIAGSGLSCGR